MTNTLYYGDNLKIWAFDTVDTLTEKGSGD